MRDRKGSTSFKAGKLGRDHQCITAGSVADPEKNLGGAEKHATTICSSIKTPHKREI